MRRISDLILKSGFAEFYMAAIVLIVLFPPQYVFLDPGLYPKFGLLALLNSISCFYLFWKNRSPLKFNLVMVFYALFLLMNLLGLIHSSFPQMALLTVFRDVQVLVSAIIVVQIIAEKGVRLVPVMFTIVSVVLASWGLIELYGALDEFVLTHDSTYLVQASLGHRNLYGQFLVLALVGSFLGLGRKFGFGAFGLVMVVSTVIVLLLSRSTWLVAVVCFSLMLWFEIRKFGIGMVIKPKIGWLVGASLILILLVVLVDDIYTLEHHFLTLINYDTGTTMDRFLLVSRSLKLGFDSLILGTGIGDWPIQIMRFDQSGMLTENGDVYYQRAHNDFAQVFAESGILAGVFYAVVFVLGLGSSLKAAMKRQDQISVIVFMLWCGLLIVGLTNFPKERPEFAVFFGILLALTPSQIDVHLPKKGVLMISMLLALVGFSLFSLRMKSEFFFTKALQSQELASWILHKEYLDQVNDEILPFDHIGRPIDWHRGYGRVNAGEPQKGRELFQEALDLNPFHPETLNGLGSVRASNGEFELAENYFLESVARTPRYQAGQINLAAIYLVQGKGTKAFDSFISADPYLVTDRYVEIGTILARDSIKSMLPSFSERKMRLTTEAIYNTPSWSFEVIRHAAMNNNPFHVQLRIEALYYLLKNCENTECAEVYNLKEKYVPDHKIDLDL
ncbi:O-antigen ligase family protein [Salibacteraceae bacterium]|nr:O-antigen ligase family protein [Salibacteraceae bacterium]